MTTIRFSDEKKGIIDFKFLKESYRSGNLQGATIFAELFKLEENNRFKDEEFNIKIFQDFDIKQKDWYDFYYFLKRNNIRNCGLPYVVEDTINIIAIIGDKFGGIPKLDEYIKVKQIWLDNKKNEYKEKKLEMKTRSPIRPHDDINKEYKWFILRAEDFIKLQDTNTHSARDIYINAEVVNEWVDVSGFKKIKYFQLRKKIDL